MMVNDNQWVDYNWVIDKLLNAGNPKRMLNEILAIRKVPFITEDMISVIRRRQSEEMDFLNNVLLANPGMKKTEIKGPDERYSKLKELEDLFKETSIIEKAKTGAQPGRSNYNYAQRGRGPNYLAVCLIVKAREGSIAAHEVKMVLKEFKHLKSEKELRERWTAMHKGSKWEDYFKPTSSRANTEKSKALDQAIRVLSGENDSNKYKRFIDTLHTLNQELSTRTGKIK